MIFQNQISDTCIYGFYGRRNRTNLSGQMFFEDEDLVQRLYSIFDPNPQIWKSKSMPYIQAPPKKR